MDFLLYAGKERKTDLVDDVLRHPGVIQLESRKACGKKGCASLSHCAGHTPMSQLYVEIVCTVVFCLSLSPLMQF